MHPKVIRNIIQVHTDKVTNTACSNINIPNSCLEKSNSIELK